MHESRKNSNMNICSIQFMLSYVVFRIKYFTMIKPYFVKNRRILEQLKTYPLYKVRYMAQILRYILQIYHNHVSVYSVNVIKYNIGSKK